MHEMRNIQNKTTVKDSADLYKIKNFSCLKAAKTFLQLGRNWETSCNKEVGCIRKLQKNHVMSSSHKMPVNVLILFDKVFWHSINNYATFGSVDNLEFTKFEDR